MSTWKLKGIEDDIDTLEMPSCDEAARLSHAEDWMHGLLEQMYGNGDVDLDRVHSCLEEMAWALQIDMPEKEALKWKS